MLAICLIITLSVAIIVKLLIWINRPIIKIRFNFLDFKPVNYYDEISVKLQDNNKYIGIIKENILIVKISGFKRTNIIQGEIKIRNVRNKAEKTFNISLNKDYINNINIKINNFKHKYYSSEIIFYGDDLLSKINFNFVKNTFNLQKRIRLVVCNIGKKELMKIITKNIFDNTLNRRIENILNDNSNQNLLINIFIGKNTSNILIFRDEEDMLIIPNENERKLFEEFYSKIDFNDINTQCSLFLTKLYEKKILFGTSLINKSEKDIKITYTSFINQGINCLIENDIVTKKDKKFMLGYLILLFYICNGGDAENMSVINSLIRQMEYHRFDEIEQIKMVISYIIFCLNYNYRFTLKFIDKFKKGNVYYDGFHFFEDIVKDLKEESEIMLMFLQLNSGFGYELLNNNYCYKISMISIEEIKRHLITNIPKYFFIYSEECNKCIISDQRTQILAFNQKKLFDLKGKDEKTKKNNTMNVVIGLFHESGHQKFHMNDKVGAKPSPILYITKEYKIGVQKDNSAKIIERGEAGKCIDNYLYGMGMNLGFLFYSGNSYKLMNKELFLGDLKELNEKAQKIAEKFIYDCFQSNDNLFNLENPFNEKERTPFDYEFVIINGIEIPCGLNVDSC